MGKYKRKRWFRHSAYSNDERPLSFNFIFGTRDLVFFLFIYLFVQQIFESDPELELGKPRRLRLMWCLPPGSKSGGETNKCCRTTAWSELQGEVQVDGSLLNGSLSHNGGCLAEGGQAWELMLML